MLRWLIIVLNSFTIGFSIAKVVTIRRKFKELNRPRVEVGYYMSTDPYIVEFHTKPMETFLLSEGTVIAMAFQEDVTESWHPEQLPKNWTVV